MASVLSRRTKHLAPECVSDGKCSWTAFKQDEQRRGGPRVPGTQRDDGRMLCLAYAENQLLSDLLALHLVPSPDKANAVVSRYELSYGSDDVRTAYAGFLSRWMPHGQPLGPDNIVLTNGCGAALEIMLQALCDAGDGVLVPQPMFSGFNAAFHQRTDVRCVPVSVLPHGAADIATAFPPSLDAFTAALDDATHLFNRNNPAHTVRVLLLCNPHNPLGRCYDPDVLRGVITWAADRGIALVVDEIFAAHVFRTTVTPMTSVLGIASPQQLDCVHIVTGLGKLGLAGLKVGAAVTRSPLLLQALRKLAWFQQVSSVVQVTLADMLANSMLMDKILAANTTRLRVCHDALAESLRLAGVPFLPAQAGLTLLLDLRVACRTIQARCPSADPFAAEITLAAELEQHARLLLARGGTFNMPEPGWFRVTFACEWVTSPRSSAGEDADDARVRVTPPLLAQLAQRLAVFLQQRYPEVLVPGFLSRFEALWRRTDAIFAMLEDDTDVLEDNTDGDIPREQADVKSMPTTKDSASVAARYLHKPIQLRHPFLFYLGHCPGFAWLQVQSVLPNAEPVDAELETLFERGIDPDVETGKVHDNSVDRVGGLVTWPSVAAVKRFRDRVRTAIRAAVLQILQAGAAAPAVTGDERLDADTMVRRGRILHLVIEHELMHQETLLYIFAQCKLTSLRVPLLLQPLSAQADADAATAASVPVPDTSYVPISAGDAVLGADFESIAFGWDNEFPSVREHVAQFDIRRYPVTNAEFLVFVNAGGYQKRELWSDASWDWRVRTALTHPQSWVPPASAQDTWHVRHLFSLRPIHDVAMHPACVSQAEARAFCAWLDVSQQPQQPHGDAGKRGVRHRLPTEAEWVRAAYGDPSSTQQRRYPWGDFPAPSALNLPADFRSMATRSVAQCTSDTASAFGVRGMLGNLWEWTSTLFDGLSDFQAYIPTYPGYSADFFDGKHYVLRGGSWATAEALLRPSFRNWFQAHYPYVFAGFRVVRSSCAGLPASAATQYNDVLSVTRVQLSGNNNSGRVDGVAARDVNANASSGDAPSSPQPRAPMPLTDNEMQLAFDVLHGLRSSPKRIPPVYFYDDVGSDLYAQITQCEDYYLTRTEYALIKQHRQAIRNIIVDEALAGDASRRFNLVELGAGDGTKTVLLLDHFTEQDHDFRYVAIDVSRGALESLISSIGRRRQVTGGRFDMMTLEGDNAVALDHLMRLETQTARQHNTLRSPTVAMFLGSSIGNNDRPAAEAFLQQLWHVMADGDLLIIGFDLKKDADMMVRAYCDRGGITAEFNFNLLSRLNATLGANFDRSKFKHFATWNPVASAMESWLISREPHDVRVDRLGCCFHFDAQEGIHVESSHKYTVAEIESLAKTTGFRVVKHLTDEKNWFVDTVWRVVKAPMSPSAHHRGSTGA